MQKTAIRRLQAHFSHFQNYTKRSFCQNLTNNTEGTKPIKKPFDSILYTQHNKNVLEILLNEPKKLNSLDTKMIKNMLRRVKKWLPEMREASTTDEEASDIERRGDEIREIEVPKVVIMNGAGGKSFCAGGDISSLYKLKKNGADDKVIKDFFRYEYLLDYLLTRMEPIQVAMWNGYVMGGGVGVSIHAPIRIATNNTLFAMPETAIGFFPDVGGTYFLPRLFNNDPSIGLYMALTGDKLKGEDMVKCGVATHFVANEKLETLKKTIIEKSADDINLETLQGIVRDFSDFTYNPDDFSFPQADEIQRTFEPDDLNEIFTRLHRLAEDGSDREQAWATNVINTLNSISPISLLVTFEQIKRGIKAKSLEEAFNIEAQMVSAFVEDSDFFEGVRAMLIDKDRKPIWKHKSYKEIDQTAVIHKFFDRSEEIDVDTTEESIQENPETPIETKLAEK